MDLITNIRLGAKGCFRKTAVNRQVAIREQKSLEMRLEKVTMREQVKVGPMDS